MKICKKCNEERDLSEFKLKQNICKLCVNEKKKQHRKKYYLKNKNKESEYMKKYREINKEKVSNYFKLYRLENKEKLNEKMNKWLEQNPNYNKEYFKTHKIYFEEKKKQYLSSEKGKTTKRKWCNKFNKENTHILTWRSLLQNTLKRLNTKKYAHTIDLLGYSAIELRTNMISKFTPGMSWDNHGEWHIDHKKPVSSFDKDTPVHIVCALDNLQPLWSTTREIDGIVYEGNLNKGKK